MSRFYKVSGAGNDFLALPDPGGTADAPPRERIRAWCSRGLSVGADGLFLLDPLSEPGSVRMRYFNADGSAADLCINGTRCAARLAVELGWSSGDRVTVVTGAGAIPAHHIGGNRVAVEVEVPAPVAECKPTAGGEPRPGLLVDAGVPHFVLTWPGGAHGADGLAAAPVRALGALLRPHPDLGPAGANVDFVRFVDAHRLEIRSFERGVEGETLACGTGVLAAVAAGLHAGELALPVTALTLGGFELRVDEAEPGRWTLAGDARLVARGELLPAAAGLPEPPPWHDG